MRALGPMQARETHKHMHAHTRLGLDQMVRTPACVRIQISNAGRRRRRRRRGEERHCISLRFRGHSAKDSCLCLWCWKRSGGDDGGSSASPVLPARLLILPAMPSSVHPLPLPLYPSCLACCLPSHCPAVLLPHLRGVPSAHCVADKRRAGASNCAGQQVPALRAHRNTRSVLQQVGNCVAHPQEHTRSGLAAGQCCNELNHGCVVYTCMYVCLYVYVYVHVCVCLLCVCVWGGGLPRTPGRRC